MADQFENVTHVAPSTVGDMLAELGATSVVEFPDLLTHGPVAPKPKKHRKARLKYWRNLFDAVLADDSSGQIAGAMALLEDGYLTTEQIGSAAAHASSGGRIVVWTTPTFEDRLFLWFVFDALMQEGVPFERIATAEPRVELPPVGDEEPRFASLRSLEVDELASGFDELFYPELVYVEAGANLWETFCSVSPRQFAISIPHTAKFFPQFPVFAEDYGRLFPMVEGERAKRVQLSEFDRDLLERLDETGRSGIELIDDVFAEKYAFLDDLVYLARLRAWSETDTDAPYVVAEANKDAEDVFEQFVYRISERGRELLEEGFEAGRKLPIFFVGDARLYAGKKPWVRVISGEHWWFERFDRGQ
ncbi:DUF1835 domain-containing protein [Persicimonas caeni]|uniref:DUF1835 domain-containing protein n=1 Tax=Persicimonas caeni TaxID=2292766 RepID=A0A4Y6PNX2_PERCE|nr:DUF1835 domain-containing protein [Persicimonas caeni]QDG50028.1 DUF1835 domain-containing protein [Persicimonas caeni]QED31249.1 DUF1835 domain-containing protein [Persicimonas caeni]